MSMRRMPWIAILALTINGVAFLESASAGPLLDWLQNRLGRVGRRNSPQVVYAYSPAVATASPQAVTVPGSCVQTCQRVSVSYVPETHYRSQWTQTPVTSYRPSTTADPCTGCQVTCMRPCTTYQWTLRRIPYTTYRPVYQTQTVQMPVASSGTPCSTCNLGTSTIAAPGTAYPVAGTTTYPQLSPYGTPSNGAMLNGSSTAPYGAPAGGSLTVPPGGSPADLPPTLDSARPPIPEVDANGNPIGSSIVYPAVNANQDLIETDDAPQGGTLQRSPTRIDTGTNNLRGMSPLDDPLQSRGEQTRTSVPALRPVNRQAEVEGSVAVQLHRPWNYSPIRFANYEAEERAMNGIRPAHSLQQESATQIAPVNDIQEDRLSKPTPTRRLNHGWRSMNR